MKKLLLVALALTGCAYPDREPAEGSLAYETRQLIEKYENYENIEAPETTEPVSVEPKEWEVVQTFTGSGIKNTSQFTVNSNEWKIEYSSTASMPEMGGAGHIFQVWMLEPGQESYEGEIVVNEVNKVNISGETNIYKSGRFYFNSNSANGDWELKVLTLQ